MQRKATRFHTRAATHLRRGQHVVIRLVLPRFNRGSGRRFAAARGAARHGGEVGRPFPFSRRRAGRRRHHTRRDHLPGVASASPAPARGAHRHRTRRQRHRLRGRRQVHRARLPGSGHGKVEDPARLLRHAKSAAHHISGHRLMVDARGSRHLVRHLQGEGKGVGSVRTPGSTSAPVFRRCCSKRRGKGCMHTPAAGSTVCMQ